LYGFMQDPIVPDALRAAQPRGLDIDADDVTYFLGRETILVTHRRGMAIWREKLFVLMTRNAVRATAFFRLPPERVVELGVQLEIAGAVWRLRRSFATSWPAATSSISPSP